MKFRLFPTLHIYIDIYAEDVGVVASVEPMELRHPNIKKKYKKSDEWLKQVNDIVRSIYSGMVARKFKILKAKPSNKSYTYYFKFQPTDENGDLWDATLELQLELRDHVSTTHGDLSDVSKDIRFRTYYIEDNEYRNAMSMLKEICNIFDDLQKGDFSTFVN